MLSTGLTVWLTGLPCSGKTTIAGLLAQSLRAQGKAVEILDGDNLRKNLGKDLGFSRPDRDAQVERAAYVAKLLSRNGIIAIVALISPYRETRERVRKDNPNFLEVYLECSVEACMARDIKGLYKKAVAGEIKQFTGVSDPYEPPLLPDVVLRTEDEKPDKSAARLLEIVLKRTTAA
jgi:adenylyl-sulfate kinase